MIRKAVRSDIEAVAAIYEHIHQKERLGETSTGWIDGVYPVKSTAEAALKRGDLFVYEENSSILGSAIINQVQVDVYSKCRWKYEASDDKVMVLHTLTVEPEAFKRGIGRKFVEFYEKYAAENGCVVLRMDTNAKNRIARSFYKKLGYIEAGCVPCVFNGIPDVQLIMLERLIF